MKMNWMKHWTKPKDSLGEPPIPLDRGAVRIKRAYMTMAASLALAMLFATPALAASDPLTAINNLSDFVFSAIKAIGAILLGFGIVQIGLALKGHDAAQRAQGFMTFFGGVVIYFANPLYAEGFSRVGCVGCPMAGKRRYRDFARWPAYEKLYIRAFDKMLEIRRQRGKLGGSWRSDTTGEDVFHWWMEDGVLPGQLSFDEYRAPIQTEKEDEWEETTA